MKYILHLESRPNKSNASTEVAEKLPKKGHASGHIENADSKSVNCSSN